MGDNGSWNIRKSLWRRSGLQTHRITSVLLPQYSTTRGNWLPNISPLWFSGILAFLGQTQILATTPFPTRLNSSSPSGRSSPALHSFCSRPPSPCSKMVHVLWFMFCALGQSFPRSLPWKSLTTVSPRLCCVLAVLLASSLPPVVLLLLLRPPILRSPALA